jgi:cyclin-dependent kinase regulatory subunit CKS1
MLGGKIPKFQATTEEGGNADGLTEEGSNWTAAQEKLKETIRKYVDKIHYSDRYSDDEFEYRHVMLPRDYYNNYIPDGFKNRLLSEDEWRKIGIQQSPGWYLFKASPFNVS